MPQVQSGLDYQVYIRDKSFNLLQMLDDYESLDYTARFNDVGEWTLTTSKFSPAVANLVRGNGLVVVNTQTSAVVMSGPIRSVEKHSAASPNLIISGWDDMVWIRRRKAWPVQGYVGYVLTSAPIRYYRLNDIISPVGVAALVTTVAGDIGSQAQNGTYVPSTSGMQTVTPAVLFDVQAGGIEGNGTNYITCPTTGLPTGNSAMTLECAVNEFSLASAQETLVSYGATAGGAHNFIQIFLDAAGKVNLDVGTGTLITSAALSTSSWHLVEGSWDGTTLALWVDHVLIGTLTPGNQTIPASGTVLRIMANSGAVAGAILGSLRGLAEVAIYSTALTTTPIGAHYNRMAGANANAPFQLSAFDTQTSAKASTVMWHYVWQNLGVGANNDRWPGDVTNVTRAPLTMAADPAIGALVAFAARFDSLLTMCQLFAVASEGGGTHLGFSLVQSTVGAGNQGALTFTIFAPVTRSNVIFSENLGTLADYTYTLDESTDNTPIVGGSGTGTARVFAGRWDQDSTYTHGRIEGFVNYSGSSDATTLQTVAIDEYTKNANRTAVDATPADALHMVFGVDYFLGDIISVAVDGDIITDVVREARLSLTVQNGALWNPVIGSVNAKQALAMLKEMLREMRASHGKILYLEGVQ